MNFRINFAGLLGALLILSSCDDPNEVGLGLPREAIFTDTFSIKTSLLQLGMNVPSSNRDVFLTGRMQESGTGAIAASAFSQLRLDTENTDLTGAVVDSVKLYLDYKYSYGDTTKPLTLHIHKLNSSLSKQTYFLSSRAASYDATPLNSITFTGSPSLGDLMIDLPDSYGTEILGAPTDQAGFLAQIYGLAFTPDASSDAAIYGLNTYSGNTEVVVYYQDNAGQSKTYKISVLQEAIRYYIIEEDRSNTVLAGLAQKGDVVSSDSLYIQGGRMTGAYLSFPYLEAMQEELGDIVVHKAELVVDIEEGGNNNIPLTYIALYEAEGFLPGKSVSNEIEGGTLFEYEEGAGKYFIPLTDYFTNLYYSSVENKGLVITPFPDVNDYLVNRSVVAPPGGSIKLHLYFSHIR